MTAQSPADIAILTVVPEAFEAVLATFGLDREEHRLGQPYMCGEVEAACGGTHIVVCDQASDRSNQPALEAASKLLRAWRPQVLIVADIGAGIWGAEATPRDGVHLGDVVVASNLEYYEGIKELKDGTEEARKFAFIPPSRGPRVSSAPKKECPRSSAARSWWAKSC
jgi:hypothetical protein